MALDTRRSEWFNEASDLIGWGLTEAAARGVPVIASAHGVVTELFDDDSAVLVPCHHGGTEPDIEVAAKLLREVADDPETADRLSRTGRWHLLRAYSLPKVADHLKSVPAGTTLFCLVQLAK